MMESTIRRKMTHKLTDEQKKKILELINSGLSPTDIARAFGVSRTTIFNLIKNKEGAT